MTVREQIEALPWYKRAVIDAAVERWAKSQNLTNYLKGNADQVPQIIADLEDQDWSMYEPQPVPDETDEPGVSVTPAEQTGPVEGSTAGEGQ